MNNPQVTIVVGGRWHAIELARELHHAGMLHRLITNYPKFKTRHWGVPDDKVVSLPFTLFLNRLIPQILGQNLYRQLLPWLYRLFAYSAARHLEGSDIVHGWSSVAEPAIHWAKQNGVPFVLERISTHITLQSQILASEYDKLGFVNQEIHPQLIKQELKEYQQADRITVPSIFAKHSFLAQGIPESRLIFNPLNGTDTEIFSPGIKEDNVFRVVYAGSLGVRKGIHYLVKAFMAADIPDSELILIGGATPETPDLIAGADERVKCPGHKSETQLADYYRHSSLFVMPSLEDGFGMVLTQAIACGIPLIATTNTGGQDLLSMRGDQPREIELQIQEYPGGYIVPPANSQAIAHLLQLLANNHQLLAQKRQAALDFQAEDLSWQPYGQRSIENYQKLSQIECVR
ncbi:MAG: glycosyltransferase family 4 protein [Waterburya sp.]